MRAVGATKGEPGMWKAAALVAVAGLVLALGAACNGGSDTELAKDFTMPLYSGQSTSTARRRSA